MFSSRISQAARWVQHRLGSERLRLGFENEAQIILGNSIALGDSNFNNLAGKRRSQGYFHFHGFDDRKLIACGHHVTHFGKYRNDGAADF
jgi:hypothetical protein